MSKSKSAPRIEEALVGSGGGVKQFRHADGGFEMVPPDSILKRLPGGTGGFSMSATVDGNNEQSKSEFDEMNLAFSHRPELPSGEAPGARTTEDSTIRSSRDRAEAAEFVQSTIEKTKVMLYSIAAIHAPIFNPESLKTKEFFDTMHRFENEMDIFATAILGKSKMNG